MSKKEAVLLQGDLAVVEGGMAAGAEFFAGYPITPASEIAEGFARELPKVGGKFIQMEDELAGMACAIGGSLSGKKSITATSGPGFSLKQENLGLGIMIEAPVVVVDVQRVGPSTGLPTSPSQGDVMQAKWGTHGDHPIIALSPSSVKEAFDLTVKAFNFAEKYRQPVILLLDEIVGHMREKVILPDADEIEVWDRKRPPADADKENFNPYEWTDDLVPPMPDYGTGFRYHTTGLFHDKTGFPRGTTEDAKKLMDRMTAKIENNLDEIILYDEDIREDDNIVVLSYGSTARSAVSAVNEARENGLNAGWIKLKTIWPFAEEKVSKLAEKANKIIVPELNQGQLIREVERAAKGQAEVVGINRYDGTLIKPEHVLAEIEGVK
ncbi:MULTISPECIES: 2-oxoacid:acceptor oxidoreductase subunit alpha [unclassified Halanaerobium]|uniref:2-oxoacid:acceptor oxidoreductase subunit alpha n=1 Tax=unclassified Halanaerobium TaxID=2641197 RepID=UPI000DF14568|nr:MULTISPECIES: 2-oxoacid:acceptor oxidoreductase subunit alpha [unclassified Halanaerobium]RCW48673.1 2-oxoglutarate ferredoxin oxidoreductase subunit alpha [Halanaerobium sp. MA284_MarDTE_T2]RCW86583.1 2-oxoglutarate ferredoxin oxidoreductase subunit alpha [Halanaerobium sp. DL-01]